MKHALLVGEMGVDRQGPVVIPEVARVERPKKGTGVEAEPLPIGRGEGPITPHRAQRQTVVGIHQDCIRGFQGLRPEAPLRHLLQHVGANPFDTVRHGGKAEVRAVGDECRQQRHGKVRDTGCRLPRGSKGTGEAAPGIDLAQEVFNPHAGQRCIDGPAEVGEPWGDLQGITPFQVQPAVVNGHKGIVRQPTFRLAGHEIEFLLETGEKVLRGLGELQLSIGMLPFHRPAGGIIDQMRKGHVPSAGGEIHVPGA
jgi:hypothetical protein